MVNSFMKKHRFYHNSKFIVNSEEVLNIEASHHIINVLKLKVNDTILLFNGYIYEAEGIIKRYNRQNAIVFITKVYKNNLESPLYINLGLSISNNKYMKIAIQKSVELGVNEITPIITKKNQIKLSSTLSINKFNHWKNIIIAACEQCGRNKIPNINIPMNIIDWFEKIVNIENSKKIILSESGRKNIKNIYINKYDKVYILIGPENGLTSYELCLAYYYNFNCLKLGPRILRAETATIVAIASIQLQSGDLI